MESNSLNQDHQYNLYYSHIPNFILTSQALIPPMNQHILNLDYKNKKWIFTRATRCSRFRSFVFVGYQAPGFNAICSGREDARQRNYERYAIHCFLVLSMPGVSATDAAASKTSQRELASATWIDGPRKFVIIRLIIPTPASARSNERRDPGRFQSSFTTVSFYCWVIS